MGKITTKQTRAKSKHVPLYREIAAGNGTFKVSKAGLRSTKKAEENEVVLDSSSSRKILQLAKEQQAEIEDEDNRVAESTRPRFGFEESEEEEDEVEIEEREVSEGEEMSEEEEVDEQDLKLFESYFNGGAGSSGMAGSFNLADKIMEKIQEKEAAQKVEEETGGEAAAREEGVSLPPRVIEAYEKVGESLSAWRHGKLPKLFKVLPTIKNWEDILYVTNPEKWTPQAMYEATKLFVSNLPSNKAQRFIYNVLYPRFREDVEESQDHKLNYHLYMSLKKCIYKPAAFFKGFLFPLVEEQCSAREAMIVASVLRKFSIPVQHSSVALSWLLEQEFSPQAAVFIRVLVEKKCALPYQTIDDLVFYFMRFRVVTDQTRDAVMLDENEEYQVSEQRRIREAPAMPLVWHKAFLAFAQRYKTEITDDQRDFLMEVVRQRGHKDIAPEIRRELLAGKKMQEVKQAQQQEKPRAVVGDDDIMAYF